MAGQMGGASRTIQNLVVVAVRADENLLLVKGGLPGARGGDVLIRPAVKRRSK
jgi:large subunit ribosomal protein L3